MHTFFSCFCHCASLSFAVHALHDHPSCSNVTLTLRSLSLLLADPTLPRYVQQEEEACIHCSDHDDGDSLFIFFYFHLLIGKNSERSNGPLSTHGGRLLGPASIAQW